MRAGRAGFDAGDLATGVLPRNGRASRARPSLGAELHRRAAGPARGRARVAIIGAGGIGFDVAQDDRLGSSARPATPGREDAAGRPYLGVEPGGLRIEVDGAERLLEVDNVMCAPARSHSIALAGELAGSGVQVSLVGGAHWRRPSSTPSAPSTRRLGSPPPVSAPADQLGLFDGEDAVVVRRSARARRLALKVFPHGAVEVVAPLRAGDRSIQRIPAQPCRLDREGAQGISGRRMATPALRRRQKSCWRRSGSAGRSSTRRRQAPACRAVARRRVSPAGERSG
jgi:hypothetical protein